MNKGSIVWDLPEGIIDLIGKKLKSTEDFITFGAVCKSWNSSAVESRKKKVSWYPWLMLATYDDDDHHKGGMQKFFSLTNNKILNLYLPQTQARRCFGTSFGWVVTIDINLNVYLLDPFTHTQISLPPITTFGKQYECELTNEFLRNFFVHKLMAIQTGNDHDRSSCVVMAIHSGTACLSFARPGDKAWKLVDENSRSHYKDVMLYNGKFYAIASEAYIEIIDISDPSHPIAIDFADPPKYVDSGNTCYLVEMKGSLHFVERVTSDSDETGYTTDFFEINEFDFGTKTWNYIDDLGVYALFLGINTSYAIDTLEFPELKPNCIYYTDDHYCQVERKFYDMGVYDYGERKKEQIYSGDNIWSEFSRPIFVKPCLLKYDVQPHPLREDETQGLMK